MFDPGVVPQTIAPREFNFSRRGDWLDRIGVMFKIVCLALATATAFVVPSFAQTAVPAPAAQVLTLKYLQPSDVDPALLLSPPIADGSDAQKADVAEVLHLQQAASVARTKQRIAVSSVGPNADRLSKMNENRPPECAGPGPGRMKLPIIRRLRLRRFRDAAKEGSPIGVIFLK